jgi:hypothetical protein
MTHVLTPSVLLLWRTDRTTDKSKAEPKYPRPRCLCHASQQNQQGMRLTADAIGETTSAAMKKAE